MASPIILDLCGGTGAWSKPYRDAGYDVRLITLPEFDVTTYVAPENVYGILAAPPCERFSLASRLNNTNPNFEEGLVTLDACLAIIRKCQLQSPLKFWALENPVGYMRRFMGRPPLTFEQWQYGDRGIKPTDIWGHYKIPKFTVTRRPADVKSNWYGRKPSVRAKTPAGFARAFYLANR